MKYILALSFLCLIDSVTYSFPRNFKFSSKATSNVLKKINQQDKKWLKNKFNRIEKAIDDSDPMLPIIFSTVFVILFCHKN